MRPAILLGRFLVSLFFPLRRAVKIVGVVLIFCLGPTSALVHAECGWLLMVPPSDEAKLNQLPDDPKFQGLSKEAKELVIRKLNVRKDAPVLEWVQWSAHDSAADCEDKKDKELKWRFLNVAEIVTKSLEGGSTPEIQTLRMTTLMDIDKLEAGRCVPASTIFPLKR